MCVKPGNLILQFAEFAKSCNILDKYYILNVIYNDITNDGYMEGNG